MDLRTYRAWSLQDALRLVREDLGPEAAVLYTRRTAVGVWGWFGMRQVEVVASVDADIPSRLPAPKRQRPADQGRDRSQVQPAELEDYRSRLRQRLKELAAQDEHSSAFIRQAR